MSYDADKIYSLLPSVYRVRDAAQGGQLKGLISVVAELAQALDEDADRLYDDMFIETCADWAVPYIGRLVGYRPLRGGPASVSSPRADVANTIRMRRRKGAASMLEELARDVTGMPAVVVEYFDRLATTQHMNHVRASNAWPDLRSRGPLENIDTPFDVFGHTADVRRISGRHGLHNISGIGIFLWRIRPYPVTGAPAYSMSEGRYEFDPTGRDIQLFTCPQPYTGARAGRMDVPLPIGRQMLYDHPDDYFGKDKSIHVTVDGAVPDAISVCDLSDAGGNWSKAQDNILWIDPVLGRFIIPENDVEQPDVRVSYHYGSGMDLGGGEYDRKDTFADGDVRATAGEREAIAPYQDVLAHGGIVEVSGSGVHDAAGLAINVGAGMHSELRACDSSRPVLLAGFKGEEDPAGNPPMIAVTGGEGSTLTINGLTIFGGGLEIGDNIDRVCLKHCTLVPGTGVEKYKNKPVLRVNSDKVALKVDHCIVGGIRAGDGASIGLADSIVDAGGPGERAYAGLNDTDYGGELTADRCTIIGTVNAKRIDASDSLFLGIGTSERKQDGCVRFSYLPPGSSVPPPYRCQPSLAGESCCPPPRLNSLRYGDPGYCQLKASGNALLRRGASDGSEMGVYHDQYAPVREDNLRIRLDEYLRFCLEAGIFWMDRRDSKIQREF